MTDTKKIWLFLVNYKLQILVKMMIIQICWSLLIGNFIIKAGFKKCPIILSLENVLIDNVLTEKIILAELYNAKLDISILFLNKSTQVIKLVQIEDEIEQYNSFNQLKMKEPLKVPSSIAKKQKVEVIVDNNQLLERLKVGWQKDILSFQDKKAILNKKRLDCYFVI